MEGKSFLSGNLLVLRKRIGQILVVGLLGLLAASLYTFYFVTPTYSSVSKIVVNQTQNVNQALTNTDIQTNLSLINTYQSIIKEPIILEEVIQRTNSNLTVEQLKDLIRISTEMNSLVFGVNIIHVNAFEGAELANAIATVFQEKIGAILEVESVTILSTATPSMTPISPNNTLNLLIGLFFGLMVGIVIAYWAEMTDKLVKDEKYIESIGWINLGSIWEMSASEINESRLVKNIANQKSRTDRDIRRRI